MWRNALGLKRVVEREGKITHRVHREKTLSIKTLRPCAYFFIQPLTADSTGWVYGSEMLFLNQV